MVKVKNILQALLINACISLVACGQSDEQSTSNLSVNGEDVSSLKRSIDSTVSPDVSNDVIELRAQLAALQERAQTIKDYNALKRLQRAYGYYMDEALWDELVDLFTEDATLEFALDGVYQGKEHIKQYFYLLGHSQNGLPEAHLNEHFQLMPIVTVADDGMTAKGRWRAIIMNGELGRGANWGEGPYENEYAKEDGVWKISKLHWYETIMVPYEGGWAGNASISGGKYVSDEMPPDAPTTVPYEAWPATFLPPFHFPNPVATYIPEADNMTEVLDGGEK